MKKFLALAMILTLALAMSVTTFADRVIGGTDGVPTLTETPFPNLINITVTAGQVQSRYAVDLEFEAFTIAVTGSELTWDVNNLVYVNTSDAADDLDIIDRPVDIYNRSDKPITVKAACVDDDANDGINIAINTDQENVQFDVVAATVGDGDPLTRRGHEGFKVSVTSDDWDAVANYYARDLQDGTEQVGQINITIGPKN